MKKHIPKHEKCVKSVVVAFFFITFADMKIISFNTIGHPVLAVLCAGFAAVTLLGSCKKQSAPTEIIVKKQVESKVSKDPLAMETLERAVDVSWMGQKYHVETVREADKSLKLVRDEQSHSYYDNRARVTIQRADGSMFFSREFSRRDFLSLVSENVADGAFLGVFFDSTDGNDLLFVASIGSPDKASDLYEPLLIRISDVGAVSITKDTRVFDENPGGSQAEDNADDGEGDAADEDLGV